MTFAIGALSVLALATVLAWLLHEAGTAPFDPHDELDPERDRRPDVVGMDDDE